MVIVTHEMSFARDVADRAIFIDDGVIVEQGDAGSCSVHRSTNARDSFEQVYWRPRGALMRQLATASGHQVPRVPVWLRPLAGFTARLAPQCRFDRSDVDLAHAHHRVERTLGRCPIRAGIGGRQNARRDLP